MSTMISGDVAFASPTDNDLTTFNFCDATCTDVDVTSGANDYYLKVWLYSDPAFDTWKNALSSPTEDEKTYRDSMSTYTLKMECNLT